MLPELRAQRCRGNSTQPRHGRRSRQAGNNYWELAKNTPLESRIGSRPHITLYGDGWGEGFGAWGLVGGDRDQRGAGVTPATHVGGQRPAPTGRMPGESPATVIHGRGDSACITVDGLKLRERRTHEDTTEEKRIAPPSTKK